jgi:hypothetical protein
LSAVLMPVLMGLNPAARRALEYAALLPPDYVPMPWLKTLVTHDFPELAQPSRSADPWTELCERLMRLALFSRAEGETTDSRIVRVHRLVQELVAAAEDKQKRREKQKRIYDLLRMIVRDEGVGLDYASTVEAWEIDAVLQTIFRFVSTYPEAASHLIGIVDSEWEGVRVFPPKCIELLEHRFDLSDSWDTRFRLAMLSYKYGLGWQDGSAQQRFENAASFARNAFAGGDTKAVFADDLKQLSWMAEQFQCDDLASELQRIFQQMNNNV